MSEEAKKFLKGRGLEDQDIPEKWIVELLEAYHQERSKAEAVNHEARDERAKVDYLRAELFRIAEYVNNVADAKFVAKAALELSST